ncbi:hypothetical protein BL253_30830 [Pseudofrankia asymbiotica]|uniref:Methyltransferase small domain-containing protein n=2 Tax=Pseudofrankia asymbiotica TaxID=1834516 RepID=A0A1V2I4K1_9ACTN|nr:hypothetical protein BL253_30830 [Pseudofrankia asymbiotica]
MEPDIVVTLRAAGCVFAEDEAALLVASADGPAGLAAMVARRCAGIPLEHVLGWAEFGGHRIVVEDGVFVPRRRTEFLVELATGLARRAVADGGAAAVRPVVVDLCCGSGALGAVVATRLGAAGAGIEREDASPSPSPSPSLALARPVPRPRPVPSDPERAATPPPTRQVELHAADIDGAAVRCARRNVVPVGGQVHEGDLYDALPAELRGRVDILIANVPYVPTREIDLMPPEARVYEPLVALDGGPDGLDVLRRVLAGAGAWLVPGGRLLVETSVDQASIAVDVAGRYGLTASVERSEEHEATVLVVASPLMRRGGTAAT